MQWSPVRLVQKRWKAAYLVGGYAVTWLLFRLLPLDAEASAFAVVSSVVNFAWIYYGTRIFRGSNELIASPRPWWRMTARPKAGFLLSALFALLAVSSVAAVARDSTNSAFWVTSGIVYGALAVLYFASSVRLRRERR